MKRNEWLTVGAFGVLAALGSAQQASACVGNGPQAVCINDKVFKGSSYSQGAIVVGENPYQGMVTVRSITSGGVYQEPVNGISVAKGCLDGVCIGSKAFKGSSYSQGAEVLGINPYQHAITVRSVTSGGVYDEKIEGVSIGQGCLPGVCVNDKIYKAASYSQGAVVLGVNPYANVLTVRSVTSGGLYDEPLAGVSLSQGCIGPVCAGGTIYRGSTYSQGATVLGVNAYQNTATVRSVTSGGLYDERIEDVGVNQGCVDGVCAGARVYRGSSYSQGAIVMGVNQYHHTVTVRSVTSGGLYEENTRDLNGQFPQPQPPQPQPPMPHPPGPGPGPGPQPQPPFPQPMPPQGCSCTIVNQWGNFGITASSCDAARVAVVQQCAASNPHAVCSGSQAVCR